MTYGKSTYVRSENHRSENYRAPGGIDLKEALVLVRKVVLRFHTEYVQGTPDYKTNRQLSPDWDPDWDMWWGDQGDLPDGLAARTQDDLSVVPLTDDHATYQAETITAQLTESLAALDRIDEAVGAMSEVEINKFDHLRRLLMAEADEKNELHYWLYPLLSGESMSGHTHHENDIEQFQLTELIQPLVAEDGLGCYIVVHSLNSVVQVKLAGKLRPLIQKCMTCERSSTDVSTFVCQFKYCGES